jgi:DNA-binding GntR family transcriptional regulator
MAERSFLEPLVQESTPSIIARKLRDAIAHGDFEPGAQLGEADLARDLGVSRGPLREAMQRLTQEGLLVSIRNRGLFVITMTDEDVRDMYLARTAVERAAAACLAESSPEESGAALEQSVRAMADAAGSEDPSAVTEADMAFHETLVALAGSPRLYRIHGTLLTETRMCIRALQSRYRSADERVAEHRKIAAAVRAGDAALVEELLVAHMDDALARLTTDRPVPSAGG